MSFYEFKESDVFAFARHVQAEVRQRGEELQFKECPYCQSGKSGKDKWTFAVNLRTGQGKCLRASCSITGNMLTLAKDFDFSLGTEADRYYRRSKKKYRAFKTLDKAIEPKPEAIRYLQGRGISERTAKRYQITVQSKNQQVLVFPFLDDQGRMQFIKYRKTDFNPKIDSSKEWCEKGCKPILFGMHQCNPENRTLILTEGQLDSLAVAEAGIENAVSVPTGKNGFTWFPYCYDWLQQFEILIVFGDCERGEITLLEDMRRRFPGTVKAVREANYQGCKDANELLMRHGAAAVRRAIEQAVCVPVRQVKELADVKSVDLYSMPRIPTGIKPLDAVLSGGIYLGQTVILTGKRGDGKSTLGSQLLAHALEQGKSVFAYSGELPDYFFKRWIDFQIAGERNIIERSSPEGVASYYIPKSVTERIAEWYRGRAFLFDNQAAEDDELSDLLRIMEKAIQQYGIELVLLDNLMTALDVEMSVDLYRAQSKFVDKLVKLSKRMNVAVILVVHPRKNRFGGDEADEVSGSGDITNKADIVLTYKRGKDIPNTERMLSVSKNRLTGKLAVKGEEIHLYYDPVSKRISDDPAEFNKTYGWEKQGDGFLEIEEPTPFD